jgi:UPF0271 protein
MGESFGRFNVGYDAQIMPFITSSSIACGFHSGDPVVMAKTVRLAKESDVAIGAHPGFQDLAGFGRRHLELSKEEVTDIVLYQVGALDSFARAAHVDLQHVKPHGALYNAAAENKDYAQPIIEAVCAFNPRLIVFALAGSIMARMAENSGLRVAHEVFVDRAYNPDGTLVPRSSPGSMIDDPAIAAKRAVRIVTERQVAAANGHDVRFGDVHTICVHGDTTNAVELAKRLKEALLAAKVAIAPVSAFL